MENIEVVNVDLTWVDVYVQNKDAQKKLKEYDRNLVEYLKEEHDIHAIVDRETISNINGELNENIKVAKERMLYEFNAYTEEDIKLSKLTKREQLVLQHKMTINRFVEIDRILGLSPSSSYIAYESAIRKIKNYKMMSVNEKKFSLLSEQQIKIYKLIEENYTDKEIAELLNINLGNIPKQRSRINQKLNDVNTSQKKLSSQQAEILRLINNGYKNKEIAQMMNIDGAVVKTQKSRIKKLGYL